MGSIAVGQSATPTYPCLIDERHVVAERYGMVNVPTAVWIDEDGFMARPPEPAGASDMFRGMDRQTFEVPSDAAEAGKRTKSFYVEALCDWIERGKQSRHALPPEEVRRRLRGLSRDDSTAAASFRLALWLSKHGEREAAAKHFETAVRLATRELELPPAEDRALPIRPSRGNLLPRPSSGTRWMRSASRDTTTRRSAWREYRLRPDLGSLPRGAESLPGQACRRGPWNPGDCLSRASFPSDLAKSGGGVKILAGRGS